MKYRLQPAESSDPGGFDVADFVAAVFKANVSTVKATLANNFNRSAKGAIATERKAVAALFKLVFDRKPTDSELDAMLT